MKITDYITNDFKPLPTDLKVSDVKLFFKEVPFTHFPVVENGRLIGMLAQIDITHYPDNDATIKDLQHIFEFYNATIPTHCIDLFTLFAQNNSDIVPVIDKNHKYLGYFELDDIIQLLYETPFLQQSSTTLIIEKDKSNYSMSEIAQIIESNNIPLLGMYISGTSDNNHQITLRIGTKEVNEVIQSLRRYKYRVLTENKDDLLIEQLKERSDYLQKYLDI
jgi:predicted transcriptional regulator